MNTGSLMLSDRELRRLPEGKAHQDRAPNWRKDDFEKFKVGDYAELVTWHQPAAIALVHRLREWLPDRVYLYRRCENGRFRVWRVE